MSSFELYFVNVLSNSVYALFYLLIAISVVNAHIFDALLETIFDELVKVILGGVFVLPFVINPVEIFEIDLMLLVKTVQLFFLLYLFKLLVLLL